MARKYDASRREEAAQRTREAILDAAFKLHGQGILEYEALATQANVSVPTIRKHFPTREVLFEGCTTWGMQYAAMPDLDLLAATQEPVERLSLAVRQTYAFYESLFGQIWGTYKYQDESPVLAGMLTQLDDFVGQIIDLATAGWPEALAGSAEAKGVVHGLLGFLTYYALRHDGGLSPEQATDRIGEALLHSIEALSRRGRKEAANV